MDVRCERCNTEYEFDDALVSGRGTTVKCTNCGHKFKIRRKDGDFSEDFWNVQTGDGRTLVFTSLRELQRAIQTSLVDRHDLLSRGGLKQKPIGQIPELAPFFEQRDQREAGKSGPPGVAAAAPAPMAGTTAASGPPAAVAPSSPPMPQGPSIRRRMKTREDFPPAPPERSELPPAESLAPVPAPKAAAGKAERIGNKTLVGTGPDPQESMVPPSSLPTVVRDSSVASVASAIADAPPSSFPTQVAPAQAAPAQAAPAQAVPAQAAEPVPAPPALRERLGSIRPSEVPNTEREAEPDTERFEREHERAQEHVRAATPPPPSPSAQGLSGTQPLDPVYLPKNTPPPPVFEASSPLPLPTQPVMRTMNLDDDYSDGQRGRSSLPDVPSSMGRRRSVGGYVVAIVVLAGVVLVGGVWAKDHLPGLLGGKTAQVPATDPRALTLLAAGEKALGEGNLELAKESFDKASALAEKDPRVLLDLARLAAIRADTPWLKSRLLPDGATDDARSAKDELAERSGAAKRAADDALAVAPDDAAALRAKIDALRIAGEREAARALVGKVASSSAQPETAYVLAALDLAETEPLWSTVIERLRLAANAESGPGRARASLVYALARSGDVAGAKAEVDRLAGLSRQHPLLPLLRLYAEHAKAANKLDGGVDDGGAIASISDGGRQRPERDGGRSPLSNDARVLVLQAEKARAKGDFDRAQLLFAAALDRNPNDTEALNGLAAIAHSRHDLNGARASYKRVLSINPSYVPALVGLGDVDWESGDRASAMKTYKDIVDRFPEGSYPARVKQRAEPAAASSSGAVPVPVPTPSATATETGGGG